MSKINISGEDIDQVVVEFHVGRARAIQAYASVEQSICGLFCKLLGIQDKLGAIVFFKITASRFRNEIIEKLLRETNRNELLPFWNSLVTKLLGPVDVDRNMIVHWATSTTIESGDAQGIVREMKLIAPNFWSFDYNNAWNTIDLQDFTRRAKQVELIVNMLTSHEFLGHLKHLPLHDIFRQPLTYPLPVGHPLYLIPKVQSPQPPSAGA